MKAYVETYVQLGFYGLYLNLREILDYYGDGWPTDIDRGCAEYIKKLVFLLGEDLSGASRRQTAWLTDDKKDDVRHIST